MVAWEGLVYESKQLRRLSLERRVFPTMGQCKHQPQSGTEGVCPSCLEKKLKSVRWGEPGDSVVVPPTKPGAKLGATIAKPKPFADSAHPKEAIAILGSIASIKNRNQRGFHPRRDITEVGLDFVLDSRYTSDIPSQPFETSTAGVIPTPGLICPPSNTSNVKDRKRWLNSTAKKSVGEKSLALQDSKPLVDRFAKETALRVIREVTDEISVEGDGEREGEDVNAKDVNGKAVSGSFFSPSHLLSKWGLKGIGGSPLVTSNNKVFPSKQSAETRLLPTHVSPARDQSRVHILTTAGADLQLASGDRINGPGVATKVAKVESVIVGMPDRILKPEDMNQRLRTSYNTVLQWLEDLPVPDPLLNQIIGDPDQDPYMKETRNIGRFKQDLAVVGHLHEIAEEHEILDEESGVESETAAAPSTGNHLNEVSSFGKFLIRAAQRQPKQGLSRVQARATALTAR